MLEERFITHLLRKFFERKGSRYGHQPVRQMLRFLIAHGLITRKTIRHFVVLSEYEEMLTSGDYKNKTQVIRALSEELGLHENTIWNIIKDYHATYGFPDRQPVQSKTGT